MKKFKLTFANGWEIIEAKDIFAAMNAAKRRCKIRFETLLAIETVI